jgi:threonine dehydrogenase-like Zn-dependent dehydrogenase
VTVWLILTLIGGVTVGLMLGYALAITRAPRVIANLPKRERLEFAQKVNALAADK